MIETFQPVLNVTVTIGTLRNVNSFGNEEKCAWINKHVSVFMSVVRLLGLGTVWAVR